LGKVEEKNVLLSLFELKRKKGGDIREEMLFSGKGYRAGIARRKRERKKLGLVCVAKPEGESSREKKKKTEEE